MTKHFCTWLSLLTLLALFFALPVSAQEKEQTYIIKKGDTLWGISQQFIDDPYYWPNLWSNNPEITNPHLIYPGQEVRIYDGRLIIVPTYDGQKPAAPPEEKAETKEPQSTDENIPKPFRKPPMPETKTVYKTGGGSEGFILAGEQPLGTIVDSVDNRALLTDGDTVFLTMQDMSIVSVGDVYGLYERGRTIIHPATGQDYGSMMHDLGYLQVTSIDGANVTAKIGRVYREIERGAELYDYVPPVMELSLKKTDDEIGGYILATKDPKLTQGQLDVIFVDLGLENGLSVGNMLYITRPRLVTEKGLLEPDTRLPDDLLGAAVVIQSRAKTAAALIVKSVKTIYRGDQVLTVTE